MRVLKLTQLKITVKLTRSDYKTLTRVAGFTIPIQPVDDAGDSRRKTTGKSSGNRWTRRKTAKLTGKLELCEFARIHRIFRGVHPVEPDRASDAVERRIRGSRCTHDGTLAVADCRRREV